MRVRTFSNLGDLPASWESFFVRQGEARSFYFSLPWFRNFQAHALEPGAELRVFAVEDGEERPVAALVGRTPAGEEDSILDGLRPGPASLSSLTGFQATQFALLTEGGEARVREALDVLVGEWWGDGVTAFELNLTLPDDPATGCLAEALRGRGFQVHQFPESCMVYEEVGERSFEAFWRDRSSRLRNTARRAEKRLARGGAVRFELISALDEVERGIGLYERVFGQSWKEPEDFPDFVPGLIRAAAAAGVLRLGVLFCGGEPVSAQLWLVSGGVASILKLHYAESWKESSPGTVCTRLILEHVIEADGVKEVDFGGGTSVSKRWWLQQQRDLVTLVAFHPGTLRGRITALLFALRRVKRGLREALAEGVVRPWREKRAGGGGKAAALPGTGEGGAGNEARRAGEKGEPVWR